MSQSDKINDITDDQVQKIRLKFELHKIKVNQIMELIIEDLLYRSETHDIEFTKNDAVDYLICKLDPTLRFEDSRHFKTNDHHIDNFSNTRGMTLISLMEYVVDQTSQCNSEKDFEEIMLKHKKEKGLTDQLYEILVNTAYELNRLSKEKYKNK